MSELSRIFRHPTGVQELLIGVGTPPSTHTLELGAATSKNPEDVHLHCILDKCTTPLDASWAHQCAGGLLLRPHRETEPALCSRRASLMFSIHREPWQ